MSNRQKSKITKKRFCVRARALDKFDLDEAEIFISSEVFSYLEILGPVYRFGNIF